MLAAIVVLCHHLLLFLPSGPNRPSMKFPNTFPAVPLPARIFSSWSARGSSPGSGLLRPRSSNRGGSSIVASESAGLVTRSGSEALRSLRSLGSGREDDELGSWERRRRWCLLSPLSASRPLRRSSSAVESVSSPASYPPERECRCRFRRRSGLEASDSSPVVVFGIVVISGSSVNWTFLPDGAG